MGLGALSHIGANAALKHTHHWPVMQRARSRQMGLGIQRGISGAQESVGTNFLRLWGGPEMPAYQQLGHQLGQQTREMSTGHRYRYLKKVRSTLARQPDLQHTPYVQETIGGINRALAQPLPRVGPQQQTSWWRKALPYAAAPAVAAVEPSGLIHAAINRTRVGLSKSQVGRNFIQRDVTRAAQSQPISALRQKATDYLISPEVQNPGRFVTQLREKFQSAPAATARMAGRLTPNRHQPLHPSYGIASGFFGS